MRRITYLIACLTLITISISACKKKEKAAPAKTTEEKFVGTWKTTQVKATIAGKTSVSFEPCFLDNKIIFNEDGSYKKTIGKIKCDPDDADSKGSWIIKNDEFNLSFTLGNEAVVEVYKLLDDNTMQHTATWTVTIDGTTTSIETVTLFAKE